MSSKVNLLALRYIGIEGGRCTGRSTVLALKYIAKCIKHPGKWYVVEDHHPSRVARCLLRSIMQGMVASLELEHFEFTHESVRCNWLVDASEVPNV